MTIDVEDYFQVEAFASTIDRADWDRLAPRVERNTERLLDILAEAGVQATFFTLGCVARRHPALVRRIVDGRARAGEPRHRSPPGRPPIAGCVSRRCAREPSEFSRMSAASPVRGYRAPTFSIGRDSDWAHAILAEEGYRYSSSVYPVRHDLYGSPDAPRSAFAPCPG